MTTPHDGMPTLLKIPEVAHELGLSKATVYRLINAGEIRTVGVGRAKFARVHRDELARYIADNTVGPDGERDAERDPVA